jgi:hypothetical protein
VSRRAFRQSNAIRGPSSIIVAPSACLSNDARRSVCLVSEARIAGLTRSGVKYGMGDELRSLGPSALRAGGESDAVADVSDPAISLQTGTEEEGEHHESATAVVQATRSDLVTPYNDQCATFGSRLQSQSRLGQSTSSRVGRPGRVLRWRRPTVRTSRGSSSSPSRAIGSTSLCRVGRVSGTSSRAPASRDAVWDDRADAAGQRGVSIRGAGRGTDRCFVAEARVDQVASDGRPNGVHRS